MACKACDKWRSKEFDDLPYLTWHAKAGRWTDRGREQRYCSVCRKYEWVRGTKKEEAVP